MAEQLWLFDPDGFKESALYAAMKKLRLAASVRTENTRVAYTWTWKRFTEWCERTNRSALPATPETVELFVTHLFEDEHAKCATVYVYATAIRHAHIHHKPPYASPVTEQVKELIHGAKIANNDRSIGKAALTAQQVEKICANLKFAEEANAGKHRGAESPIRSRAVMLMGFASGMRRSEIVGLNLEDVVFKPTGMEITIQKSKTNPAPVTIGIHKGKRSLTCPVRANLAWLKTRGKAPGPFFTYVGRSAHGVVMQRLDGKTVNQMVKLAVKSIGLDPAIYGAHSLRAGFATEAALNGASVLAIRERTRHKRVQNIVRYIRNPNPLAGEDPLRGRL